MFFSRALGFTFLTSKLVYLVTNLRTSKKVSKGEEGNPDQK